MDPNKIFAISALINGLTALAFFIVVLFGLKKSFANRIFALFTFFIWFWSLGYYFWLNSSSYEEANFWIVILNLGSIFIPITYYHWIATILQKNRKVIIKIGYTLTFIVSFFSSSKFFYTGLSPIAGFHFWPVAGVLYPYYVAILYGGYFFLGLFDIIDSFFKEKGAKKKMIRFILVAYLISLISGASNFPLWFGIKILPYGNFIVFVHVFLFSYAMMKYNLMNMKTMSIQVAISFIAVVTFVEMLISNTIQDFLMRVFLLIIMIFFFSLIIKTSKETNKQKEKLEKLTTELKQTNRKLIVLDNAKNEFVSIAAHQLRTPPTVIKGYVSMALEEGKNKLDNKTKDYLKRALISNERLIELVEDILDISRIESGKIQYNFKDNQDCSEIVDELYKLFEIRAREKGLKLILKKSKTPLLKIKMDSKRIREVISNLIDNAIKYTQKGEVIIETKNIDEKKIRIEVSDTGAGIPKKDMSNLFKKFSRGTSTKRLGVNGTGLGIYVGKKMVKIHHGKIWAESEGINKGSKFVIELPVKWKE
ncbi:MAG TPA: sensor histidine kinase [Candidatus Moranbacteria bacterium]|nr:sensor histidine kinase [Candidatus Moranbacteria bacterium]